MLIGQSLPREGSCHSVSKIKLRRQFRGQTMSRWRWSPRISVDWEPNLKEVVQTVIPRVVSWHSRSWQAGSQSQSLNSMQQRIGSSNSSSNQRMTWLTRACRISHCSRRTRHRLLKWTEVKTREAKWENHHRKRERKLSLFRELILNFQILMELESKARWI